MPTIKKKVMVPFDFWLVFLLPPGGGGTQLFCSLDFRTWGLWADKLQWKWGLVSRFSSKTGALELIFCKIFKLITKIAVKFELLELKIVIFSIFFFFFLLWKGKISHFSFKWGLVNGLVPQLGDFCTAGEVWKGSLEGCTSPYPLFRWVPRPSSSHCWSNGINSILCYT